MKDYVSVVYNEKERPITNYPVKLAQYLFNRFNMKKGYKLLDNGCGRGDFLKGFQRLGLISYGVDISEFSKKVLKDVEFYIADTENGKLPFEDNFFDIIFTKSVVEHLHKPDNFMKESYRVLKPGGRIIVMTPDWKTTMYIFYDDHTHIQPYTVSAVRDLLLIHGFKNVTSEIFYQLPILWRHPYLKIFSKFMQLCGPVKRIYSNKFIRWSRELMILGTGVK